MTTELSCPADHARGDSHKNWYGNWSHGQRKGKRREDQPMVYKTTLGKEERLKLVGAKDTSADPENWTPENPLYGHCAIASVVVQDLLGGQLKNGRKQTLSHYWNILPDGTEVDYTKSQFPEMPEWESTTLAKQRDYILSFPATAERYSTFKTRFEAAQ